MSSPFILNPKDIPLKVGRDSSYYKDYLAFWAEEKRKCIEGINVGNIYLPGWLYWHINHWTIEMDVKNNNETFKKKSKPSLRDNDWIFTEYYYKAKAEKKGLLALMPRRIAKSVWCSSLIGYYYTLFDDVQALISSGNAGDNSLLCEKCEIGLTNLYKPFKKSRLYNDWGEHIVAGYKNSEGDRLGSNSRIIIRNFRDGVNSEAAAGTAPKIHVFDEIGKFRIKSCFNASIPCYEDENRNWFCTPILMGTGGDMERGQDAIEMFSEPDVYNLISIPNKWEDESQKICIFIPSTHRERDCAVDIPLLDYIESKGDIKAKDITVYEREALENTFINVINEEEALKLVTARRDSKAKSKDNNSLNKEKMYYPLIPSEILFTNTNNKFNIELLKKQLYKLTVDSSIGNYGYPVHLIYDINKNVVAEQLLDLKYNKPLLSYPINKDREENLKSCIWIFEPPVTDSGLNLYIMGTDSYDHDQANSTTSVGATYVYKRSTGKLEDSHPDQIVAMYVGRPEFAEDFYEKTMLLAMKYKAINMVENANRGIFTYHYNKHKDSLLADTQSLLKGMSPTGSVSRTKGFTPLSSVIKHGNELIDKYISEKIDIVYNDDGTVKEEVYGVSRIKDKGLILELISCNDKDNFDRVDAFRACLLYNECLFTEKIKSSNDYDIKKAFMDKYNKSYSGKKFQKVKFTEGFYNMK